MHPTYDPRDLSDDDLLDKLGKAYEYLAYQSSLGHASTVASIEAVINQLEFEKIERFERAAQEEEDRRDPDKQHLNPITLGTTDNDQDIK